MTNYLRKQTIITNFPTFTGNMRKESVTSNASSKLEAVKPLL
jgi:hypothetical protein